MPRLSAMLALCTICVCSAAAPPTARQTLFSSFPEPSSDQCPAEFIETIGGEDPSLASYTTAFGTLYGCGGFGCVYSATSPPGAAVQDVAAKYIPVKHAQEKWIDEHPTQEETIAKLTAEFQVQARLSACPDLTQVYAYCTMFARCAPDAPIGAWPSEANTIWRDGPPPILTHGIPIADLEKRNATAGDLQTDFVVGFLEPTSGGDVNKHFEKEAGGPSATSDQDLRKLFVSMTRGLACMHSQDAVHLDVKGANFVLTPDGEAKLSDFGNSAQLSAGLGLPISQKVRPDLWEGEVYLGSASTLLYLDQSQVTRNFAPPEVVVSFLLDQVSKSGGCEGCHEGCKAAVAASPQMWDGYAYDVFALGVTMYSTQSWRKHHGGVGGIHYLNDTCLAATPAVPPSSYTTDEEWNCKYILTYPDGSVHDDFIDSALGLQTYNDLAFKHDCCNATAYYAALQDIIHNSITYLFSGEWADIGAVLRKMLRADPAQRITADQAASLLSA